MTGKSRDPAASLGSVAVLIGVAAFLLAAWAAYRTRRLSDFDDAVVRSHASDTDIVCDLIRDAQKLRERIESLERKVGVE